MREKACFTTKGKKRHSHLFSFDHNKYARAPNTHQRKTLGLVDNFDNMGKVCRKCANSAPPALGRCSKPQNTDVREAPASDQPPTPPSLGQGSVRMLKCAQGQGSGRHDGSEQALKASFSSSHCAIHHEAEM